MNFSTIINVFCALALYVGGPVAVYKTYKFVRHEVMMQAKHGLPSLEKFSRALTGPD